MVCTSIGLTVKGVPVIGVIYNPFLDQLVSTLLHLPVHPTLLNSASQYLPRSPSHIFLLTEARLPAWSPYDSLLTGYSDVISSTD
jgi:hypothetical protein